MPHLLAATTEQGLEEGGVPGQDLFLQRKVVTSQQVFNHKGECASWNIPSKLEKGVPALIKRLTAITGQVIKHEAVGITGIDLSSFYYQFWMSKVKGLS